MHDHEHGTDDFLRALGLAESAVNNVFAELEKAPPHMRDSLKSMIGSVRLSRLSACVAFLKTGKRPS
jgi:hypothetical protein